MKDNVEPIFGGPSPRVTSEACVEVLEEMLELAKSGEMKGLAAGFTYVSGGCTYRVSGSLTRELVGAIACGQFYISSALLGGDDYD